MKNVLLLVHNDPGQEARFQAALDLTRALAGHLYCLDVTPFMLVYDSGWGFGPSVVVDESDQEAANKARMRQRLSHEDVSWSWLDAVGDYADCLLAAGKTADVIVLNRKFGKASRPDMLATASKVLTQSEALVVAVDETCQAFAVAGPALIAWDGSDKALHALQRAVPLLALAGEVEIFQAGPLPEGAIPAEEAAAYLSRHGIKAIIDMVPESDDPAAEICAAAKRLGASYCVMGAYGHNRLEEALLGGVSRRMLSAANIPLVLAH